MRLSFRWGLTPSLFFAGNLFADIFGNKEITGTG
jgi:hypothetical protein